MATRRSLPGRLLRWTMPLVLLSVVVAGKADAMTTAVAADARPPYAASVPWPSCAVACLAKAAVATATTTASPRPALCTASQDASLARSVRSCLAATCSPADALGALRSLAQQCAWPVRSRRASLEALFAIQAPALACLALRLYGRATQAARLALDDYLVLLLTPVFVVFLVLGQYAAAIAFGVDVWTVPPDDIVRAMKAFYVDEVLYLVLSALIKLSILFLYLRLFAPQAAATTPAAKAYRRQYRVFRAAVLGAAALVLVPSTVFLFLDAFQCRPVDAVWAQWTSTAAPGGGGDGGGSGGSGDGSGGGGGSSPPAACLDVPVLANVAASFGIAQDAAILLLPWPLLVRLRQSLAAHAAAAAAAADSPSFSFGPASAAPTRAATAALVTAAAMFGLGVFVLVTSCLRLRVLVHFDAASTNPTWDNTDSLIWSGLEVSVAVVVMSLPTVRVLGQRAWRRWRDGPGRP